jgi:hypothetical protein
MYNIDSIVTVGDVTCKNKGLRVRW